jgi:hypothetical protein
MNRATKNLLKRTAVVDVDEDPFLNEFILYVHQSQLGELTHNPYDRRLEVVRLH